MRNPRTIPVTSSTPSPIAILALLLILAGCQRGPALASCEEATTPRLVIDRCFGGEAVAENFIGDIACFPFGPAETMKGIWRVSKDRSAFRLASDPDVRQADMWLETADVPAVAQKAALGDRERRFAVELVARPSLCPGFFGHDGTLPREIVVERFTFTRPVGT